MKKILLVISAVAVLSACGNPRLVPAFSLGQMVEMKAFGVRGMVVKIRCPRVNDSYSSTCKYSIRFSALQARTNVSLLGSDGPIDIAPIAIVHQVREYELKEIAP